MSAVWAEATAEEGMTKEQIREQYGIDMSEVKKGPGGRRVYPEYLRKQIVAVSYKVDQIVGFADELGIHSSSIHQWRRRYGKGEMPSATPETNGTVGLPVVAVEKRVYNRRKAQGPAATFECASVADAALVLSKLVGVSAGRVSITIH